MSHREQHGWERFTSYNITMVSRTSQCHKWIRMDVRVDAWSLHTSTGQGLGPTFSGNVILNVLGLFGVREGPS